MKANNPKKSAALLGVAFDAQDGQTRVTKGTNFVLWGGSEDTHGFMQETAIKINEKLDQRSKRLEEVSGEELRDICQEAIDSIGGP